MAETSRYMSFLVAALWSVHGYLAAQKPTFAAVTTKVGFEPERSMGELELNRHVAPQTIDAGN